VPEVVVEWGGVLGGSHALLSRAYPGARIVWVEADALHAEAAFRQLRRPWWAPQRWFAREPKVLTQAALTPGGAQLLWANMGLHFEPDPLAVMQAWHRAIAVDGFLMFSTLGPGSLEALRTLYAQARWAPPFAPFVDMHDLGDMLIEAGFADPVMDQESVTLTWPDAAALLKEMRGLGGNASPSRADGLRTPRWLRQLQDKLTGTADASGRVGFSFEVVYGHAFRPLPRPRVSSRTEVTPDDLRAMARAPATRAARR
jgi:malonyl-CoA O-methyltransferase